VLGGSSSLNGLLYVRGQAQDYDTWCDLGNPGWSYEEVLPYFNKSENQENEEWHEEGHIACGYHGKGGPLAVSNQRMRSEIGSSFIKAMGQMGVPIVHDFNGKDQEGVGYFQLTASGGFRCSTSVGFLKPAKARPNLTVLTNSLARQVLLDDTSSCATGVEYSMDGVVHQVLTSDGGEVVLSAGAINSPHLLQLSGIGPAPLLQKHGIKVRHALLGVGENLMDHLQIRMVQKVNVPTLNSYLNSEWRKVLIGLQYMFNQTGPLSMAASQVGAFVKTDPALATPDVQFHFQPLSAAAPGEGLDPFSAFTSSVCQLRPLSKGRVVLQSSDPSVYPACHSHYLEDEEDQRCVVAAMKFSRQVCTMTALAPFVEDEVVPGRSVVTDEELLESAREIGQSIYHPAGTCKMGPGTDPMAVLDSRLKVYGIDGLRVVDCSITPTIPSGNTNAPTIMIAEKAADMIKEDRALKSRAGSVA